MFLKADLRLMVKKSLSQTEGQNLFEESSLISK